MKRLLIFSMLIATAIAASADPPHKKTFTAPAVRPIQPKPTPPIAEREAQGVLPRAFRGGNPLQMFNPKAPAVYGTSAQSIDVDPDTGKIRGIKLFEIFF
jgi:hypothetical protein